MSRVRFEYEEEPGDADVLCHVVLQVPIDGSLVYRESVEAVDPEVMLNARQEQEAVERAVRSFAEHTGRGPDWSARVRVRPLPEGPSGAESGSVVGG